MSTKTRVFPLAAACLLAIASRTAAQGTTRIEELESLAGLDGLFVVVESLDDEAQEGGLTRDALQAYLEMRLRQARIPLLSKAAWWEAERKPTLYLNLMTHHEVSPRVPIDAGLEVT